MSTENTNASQQIKKLDAEKVTMLAENFLSRMGYRKATLHPKKATVEGEKYLVEVTVKKRTATVQVDMATGEIKGFQIEEAQEASGFALSNKMMVIAGVAVTAIALVALTLTGILKF